ncbi:hypothetical protein PspLS_07978 [Pyricularia sp. CBS 133598]|nr:hypothetical protein PspLS_07978 [Pyricularia sp. CBS 133598]
MLMKTIMGKENKPRTTYHWTKSRDTSTQCQHSPDQADLVEALAEYVKDITGRDAGDVDVDAIGEHQARALDDGGARDDAPDAEDLELALLELLGRGVAADGAAGLQPAAVEAGDLARVRQVSQQLAARDALPRDREGQGRDRSAEHPGLADDLGQGHRGGRVVEGRDGGEVGGIAERAPVVGGLGLVEVGYGEQVALDGLVGVLAEGVVAKHGADEEVLRHGARGRLGGVDALIRRGRERLARDGVEEDAAVAKNAADGGYRVVLGTLGYFNNCLALGCVEYPGGHLYSLSTVLGSEEFDATKRCFTTGDDKSLLGGLIRSERPNLAVLGDGQKVRSRGAINQRNTLKLRCRTGSSSVQDLTVISLQNQGLSTAGTDSYRALGVINIHALDMPSLTAITSVQAIDAAALSGNDDDLVEAEAVSLQLLAIATYMGAQQTVDETLRKLLEIVRQMLQVINVTPDPMNIGSHGAAVCLGLEGLCEILRLWYLGPGTCDGSGFDQATWPFWTMTQSSVHGVDSVDDVVLVKLARLESPAGKGLLRSGCKKDGLALRNAGKVDIGAVRAGREGTLAGEQRQVVGLLDGSCLQVDVEDLSRVGTVGAHVDEEVRVRLDRVRGMDLDRLSANCKGKVMLGLGTQDVDPEGGEGIVGPRHNGHGRVCTNQDEVLGALDVRLCRDGDVVHPLAGGHVENGNLEAIGAWRPVQADHKHLLEVSANLQRQILGHLTELPDHGTVGATQPSQRRDPAVLLVVQREHILIPLALDGHLHDLEVAHLLAFEIARPDVAAADGIPGLQHVPGGTGDPALALGGPQVAYTVGIFGELLAPERGAAAWVDGAQDAKVGEGVEEGGAVIAARAVEEGRVLLRQPDQLVVEVNIAHFVLVYCQRRRQRRQ